MVLEDPVCMFGQERDKVLELRNVAHMSGYLAIYHGGCQKLTAILRSSIELICLNASIAAAYHRITSERTSARHDRVLTNAEGSRYDATLFLN